MSWQKTIERYGSLIEDGLKKYFVEIEKEAGEYHPFIEQIYSDLEGFVLRGGKKLASCSTLLTYKGYAGELDDKIIDVCIGIELYRHAILIHDDLVDMSSLRRGGKTLHEIFKMNYGSRFGEGTAIFTGNIAYALALRAIMASKFSEDKIKNALSLLSEGYRKVNESQILDLLFEYKDVDVDEWQIMASKRAASLFKVTLLIGAILGGAGEKDLNILKNVAKNIGYSFDIQDDIIDTFSDEDQYGRPPCGDIALGKKPLHIIRALTSENEKKSEKLSDFIGTGSLSQEDVSQVRELVREAGGLEAAKKTSGEHAKEARKLIGRTTMGEEVKEFFNSLVAYMEENLDWYR
ncbi:hypothetical protein AKJ45_01010 [candidate division MSBL1 archaeon SCGC-AAA261F19]|uniref:Polyprenyl synthetase n=2 Tax=candidate division MSBL1 TaxID=215777 RepID=A0A133VAX8_9EURY|nr:hypothetical protein AKJ43_01200 [candidate division MSBL1 archaeon SCGC-AAA261D19]KXB03618.1 hypothetical protein AKJ45_01010 [candidate division MSBL1 archaeon SCGC-AAA261F19]